MADAESMSKLAVARGASGLTIEDARKILGYSYQPYKDREEHPEQLSIGDLRTLYKEFNSDGKKIVAAWLSNYFGFRCDV